MKRSRSISSSHAASLPPQAVVYAVGDIHGRLDLLQGVIKEIERAAAAAKSGRQVTVVFLGDYIDRGPEARGVIDRLIAFRTAKSCEIVFLRGNHEQFLIDMIDGRAEGTAWLEYGGVETMASYGVAWPPPHGPRDVKRLGEKLRETIPPAHIQFLRETQLHVERGDYAFVHAGLRPERLMSEQSDADMLWFRYYADDEPMHGKTVVHGHTPRPRPVAGRWRIGIDTEAYDSGALTTARFEGDSVTFLKVQISSGEEGTRVSEWDEIDRPHDRQEQTVPAPRSKRTQTPQTVGRGGLMAAGAVAVAAIMVVGILVGLVVWFKGRGESDSSPVRPAASAPPMATVAAGPRPSGPTIAPAAPPDAAASTPPVLAKPVTLAAKAPSGPTSTEPAPSVASAPADVKATPLPPPSPPPSTTSTTAAGVDAGPIRTAPSSEGAPATPPGAAS